MMCLLLAISTIYAQTARITGKVVEKSTSAALEYATVALYKSNDTALVSGAITGKDGSFSIDNVPVGRYIVKVHFIGYDQTTTAPFSLGSNQKMALGNISVAPSSKMVNEVQVNGTSVRVANKLEKQTYRADLFETAKGGSAISVLKNMPSVAVNGQGEITLRGSTGFLVLIDGKPVLTDAQTALSQIPANTINNIELITSPSAKYDPDGKTGIVNITTKQGATDGAQLIVNVQGGLPSTTDFGNDRVAQRYGADVLYTFKKENLDVTLGGNYSRNDLNGYREGDVSITKPSGDTINHFPSTGERSFKKYYYAVRGAATYTFDKSNVLSVGVFSGKRFQERDANLDYLNAQYKVSTNTTIYNAPYYNANKQVKEGTFTLGNIDYTHTFTDKSKLVLSALYEYDDLYGNTYNNNFANRGGTLVQYVENPYSKPVDGLRLKADYSTDIAGGKLETGYQFRNDSQDGVFDYLITPPAVIQPHLDKFSGTALSNNTINSVYTQFSASKTKLDYNVGLRYEYSHRTVDLSTDTKVHELNLSNLFPSANLQYKLASDLKLKAGISRRIQRSSNNQLNPIPEREHSETLEAGDPDLLPEYITLSEIGLTKTFKSGSIFGTFYYQASKNPVQRVNSIYADTILNRVYTNVAHAYAMGFETGLNIKPTQWWTLYAGANVFKQKFDGTFTLPGETPLKAENSDWVYSLNMNSDFALPSGWNLQANVNYLSEKPTAQGKDSRFLSPNLTLKKGLFNNMVTASVQWQNIDLGMKESNRQRITTWGDNFYTTTNYIYETDVVMVNLGFNLNKKSSKAKLPESEFGEKEF